MSLDCRSHGSRCCDRLSCWLESELCENISARLQTYLGCESFGTANEHKTATRIRPSSDQAYCRAESKIKSKMVTSFRSEENWKNAVFPQTWAAVAASTVPKKAQESRGQKRSTETLGTSQPSKTVNLNTTPIAMDLGDVVQAPARPSAVTPMVEGELESSPLALLRQQ